jgi:trk system potassium uptake protein TrkA
VRQGVPKVVVKNNRGAYADIISAMGLDSVVSPKTITCDYILRYVRQRENATGTRVERLYKLVNGKAEALEFHVEKDAPVIGVPLMNLKKKDNLLIACIGRRGKIIFPRGQDAIQAGDTVIVVTTHTGFKDISDILI